MSLAPLMSNTKWDELRLAMYGLCPPPSFQCTGLNGDVSMSDREWFYHFRADGYGDILHVDIEADGAEHREAVREALTRIHLPGEETSDGFRVYGYAKPGQEIDYI